MGDFLGKVSAVNSIRGLEQKMVSEMYSAFSMLAEKSLQKKRQMISTREMVKRISAD